MKNVAAILCLTALFYVTVDAAATRRMKRAAYALPDGVEFYVGEIRTTFQCPGNGYYADTDNNCQLFHICLTNTMPDGTTNQEQHTFACGNQTVFNQFSMTCDHAEDAVPCEQSSQFHYLNDLIGQGPTIPLHQDQDIERAAQYGSRTLSARANLAATERNEPRAAAAPQPAARQPAAIPAAGRSSPGRRRTRPRTQPLPAIEAQPSTIEIAAS